MYLCIMENPDSFIDACARLLASTGRFELLINEELCMLKTIIGNKFGGQVLAKLFQRTAEMAA